MNKTTETSFCSRPAALFACGRQSIRLPVPVYIRSSASVVGSREKQGPLGELFDFAGEDDLFGCDTWEDAESSLQRDALHLALQKAGLHSTDIRYLFAGDLLGQSIATSFGLMQYERPLFGLYGACSTCGLSLSLASLAVSGGFCRLRHKQPFRQRRKGIPFSARLRQSAAAFRLLDCDRKRCVHPRKRSIWA